MPYDNKMQKAINENPDDDKYYPNVVWRFSDLYTRAKKAKEASKEFIGMLKNSTSKTEEISSKLRLFLLKTFFRNNNG